jgi:hypothetical protein
MVDDNTHCPVCRERLATKGLSFFMINVVVDKHSKASPKCQLRVELNPGDKTVEIKRASEVEGGRHNPLG